MVPTIETIFARPPCRQKYIAKSMLPPDHKRWRRAKEHPTGDPTVLRQRRRSHTSGLPALEATGVFASGPDDLDWIVALLITGTACSWRLNGRSPSGGIQALIEKHRQRYFIWSTTNQSLDLLPARRED